MKTMVVTFLSAVLLASPAFAGISASFEWGPTKKCFDSKSPPFKVSGVPKGTKTLRFKMVDLDSIDYPHGGGDVAYSGQASIPYGAFTYSGPCPPQTHIYQFTISALDGNGKEMSKSVVRKKFSP